MCGGGREQHDIEEAKRMDEEEQSNKAVSTNIQISVVRDMLMDSEPELFGQGNAKLMPVKNGDETEKDWWFAIR